MPAGTPEDNKRYCKAYYQRIRRDPEKYAAWLAKNRRWYHSRKRRLAGDHSQEEATAP